MANYRATQSPTVALTVNAVVVTYNTAITLDLMQGGVVLSSGSDVQAGNSVQAVCSLMTTGTVGPVSNATVKLTITPPSGSAVTMTGVTDSTGSATIDLSSFIGSAQAGTYSFISSFGGGTMTNYYNASQSTPATLQITEAVVCTQGAIQCVNGVSEICQNNAWVNGGNACAKPVPSIDPMMVLAGVGLVALVGAVAVAASGPSKPKRK